MHCDSSSVPSGGRPLWHLVNVVVESHGSTFSTFSPKDPPTASPLTPRRGVPVPSVVATPGAEEQVRAQVCSWKRRPSQVTQAGAGGEDRIEWDWLWIKHVWPLILDWKSHS